MEDKKINRKKVFALGTLVLLAFFVFFGIFYIKNNLENIVNYALKEGLKYNIYVEKVEVGKFGTVKAKKVLLRDKTGRLVFDVPEIEIHYNIKDILKGKYISQLWAKNPIVHLKIYEVSKLNIMDALNLYVETEETGKPSPLQYVKVTGGTLYYNDTSYKKPIDLKISKLDGYVDLKGKLKLYFQGEKFDDESQFLSFAQEEYKKGKYQFDLVMKNVEIQDELVQYAYDDKESITYKGGRADLNLTFGGKGVKGQVFIKKGTVKYQYLKDDLKNVQASINIDGGKLDIFAKANLTKYPMNFKLDKKDNKLGIFFDSKNVDVTYILANLPKEAFYKDISGNVDTLKGQLVFEDVNKSHPALELFAESKGIAYLEHKLNNTKLKLDFDFNRFKFDIKALDFDYENNLNPEYFVNMKGKLKGVFEKDKLKLNYSFQNIKSFFDNSKFNGNFEYDLKNERIQVKNSDVEYPIDLFYDIKTSDIKLKGTFNEAISFTTEKLKTNKIKGNIDVIYNINKKKMAKAFGNLNINNSEYFKDFNISFDNKGDVIYVNDLYGTRGNSSIKAKGTINTQTLEYNAEVYDTKIYSKDFPFMKDFPEFNLNTNFNIRGKGKDFEMDYTANIEKIEYGALLKDTNFKGKIEYKNNDFKGNAEGYIKELIYEQVGFKDLYVELDFDKEKINIDQIKNEHLFVKGNYYIGNGSLDLDYELKDYDLEKVKASEYSIKGYISKMHGKIKDSATNPTITVNLEKSFINYNNTENAQVYGNLSLKNHFITLQDFYFKENHLTGTINLEKETLNLKANLLETNLNTYYKDTNVKYRVIGTINVWGSFKDIRAVAQVNLDNIYYKGKKIPDLFVKLSYINGDLNNIKNSGRANLTELRILGENGFNLMEADGYVDMFTKEFKIKLGNENIATKDIEYLVNDYKINGKVNLNFEAKGNLNGKIDYSLDLKSTGLTYNNIVIDKISGKITGNEKNLSVDYLQMNYGKNTLNAQGNFNIEKSIYDFSVKAKDVDLGIFNLFLSQKIKNLRGNADVDISLKNDDSFGSLELKNVGFETPDKSVTLSSLNSKIELNKDGIKIKSFTGRLNNGTILLDGYLKIPKFDEEFMANPMESLKDYSLSIKLDDVDYYYDKILSINVDTDLEFSNKLLTGQILVNKGNVFKLPAMTKKENEPESVIGFNANLEINIGEGIYFRADNIPLVDDIELKIEGGGILEIKNNRISFIGKLFSEDGALTFNNSIFSVSSGIIIFDGINEYFPNVNPSLAIKAQTKVQTEDIYITISGYYDALSLDLQSSRGLNAQEITNLLLFKTSSSTTVNTFVKDILDKQFSDEIFSPLSKELEKLLNISKVKISSKILKLDQDSLSLNPDLLLGAEFELSNPLKIGDAYKDKVYWNLKTRFSDEKSGEFAGTNLWLDYKVNNNLAWKLGAEKSKEFQNPDKTNLYLGIDFKYQTKSIFKKN